MISLSHEAIGKSHAKIILMGEHSAVYGKPAVVLPISNVQMKVTVKPALSGRTMQSKYFIGSISKAPSNLLGTQRLIQTLLRRFHQTSAAFSMRIESTIPSERGMGSSAATAVAVTRALYNYFHQTLTHRQLLADSNIEEKITHGNPSGMDAATVSSSTPVWFVSGHPIRSTPVNLDGALVIADSGVKGRTDIAVNSVRQQIVNHPKVGKPEINALGTLAIDAKHQLATDQIASLGKDMTAAQKHLANLGVSSSKLDYLIKTAINNGAYGAKLTGSGLGGCIIALVKNRLQAKKVSKVLLNAGAVNTWLQPFKKTSGDQND